MKPCDRIVMTITTAITLLHLAGCFFNPSSPSDSNRAGVRPGMAPISAKGKSFLQGSSSEWATFNEKPPVENRFTYDFQLDSAEVTQAAFRSLMGRDPVATEEFGKGDDYPVYNVSWFDAILFCNARSKAAGLDTVYGYTRIDSAPDAGVYALADLSIRLDRAGYRLPTEAEWEFAARDGAGTEFPWGGMEDSTAAGKSAWSASNAGGRTHPVASLARNRLGIYDLAGNVMEWVNDWMGPYPKQGSEDFAGARDPGILNNVPVKGGAFRYGIRELRPANRSATYTTIRSAKSEYVGFRCAYGPIARPRFSSADGELSETDPVTLNIERIQDLVEGRPVRLVFVNATQLKRHLAFVDFKKQPARVREFSDVEEVFYPVISPDGNWVAYGTKEEGVTTGSLIHVRALGDSASADRVIGPGFIPRWWVDPATGDTLLLYTTSAGNNNSSQWASSKTLSQKMKSGQAVGEPLTIAEGAFHDGRSTDGNWLATGFTRLKLRKARTGESRTLFTAPENGKEAGDTSQVCNVSIAPDSSGRTLFLDFGFTGISGLTGFAYDIHQVGFMADSQGKVLRWYKAPAPETGWEGLEWSNHPDFAVSSSTDKAGGHRRLYLLDLKHSEATLLATGTQLATPGLWIGPAPAILPVGDLKLDSLGRYNDPPGTDIRGVFANKLNLFWRKRAEMEGAFVGSSQMVHGLNPDHLTVLNGVNLGYASCGLAGMSHLVRNYILPHSPKLKLIGLNTLIGWFSLPGGDGSWTQQVQGSKGLRYDADNGFWKSGLPIGLPELAALAPYPAIGGTDLGFSALPANGWGGSPLPMDPWAAWNRTDPNLEASLEILTDLIGEITSRNVRCVFIVFPQSPEFRKMPAFSSEGPDWSTSGYILDRLREIQNRDPLFRLIDANRNGQHDYGEGDGFDSMHMSDAGAKKLGARLNNELGVFLEQAKPVTGK